LASSLFRKTEAVINANELTKSRAFRLFVYNPPILYAHQCQVPAGSPAGQIGIRKRYDVSNNAE